MHQTWHDHFIYFILFSVQSVSIAFYSRDRENIYYEAGNENAAIAIWTWIMFSLLKSDKFSLIFAWQLSERNGKMAKYINKNQLLNARNWIFCGEKVPWNGISVERWLIYTECDEDLDRMHRDAHTSQTTGFKIYALNNNNQLWTTETNTRRIHSNQASL